MVFPKNNLPTGSQPWTRDVEKRVENLESSFRSAEVNNVTRDSQALSQIRRIDQALSAVVSLGEPGSGYNVNASNVTAGTFVGSTIKTDVAPNERIELNQTNIEFYNADGNLSGILFSSPDTTYDGMILSSSNNSIISVDNTGAQIVSGPTGSKSIVSTSDSGTVYLKADAASGSDPAFLIGAGPSRDYTLVTGVIQNNSNIVTSGGYLYTAGGGGVYTNGGNVDTGGGGLFTIGGALYTSGGDIYPQAGNIYANEYFIYGDTGDAIFNGFTNVGGDLSTDSGLRRTLLIGGGTTACNITDGGFFVRATSSERYKQDIENADFDYDSIINLQPKTFRLKEEVENNPNAIRYPGLIAEDLAGTPLDVFVSYEVLEDGSRRPDGIRYAELTSALISAIKHQDSKIKSLEERMATIESRTN